MVLRSICGNVMMLSLSCTSPQLRASGWEECTCADPVLGFQLCIQHHYPTAPNKLSGPPWLQNPSVSLVVRLPHKQTSVWSQMLSPWAHLAPPILTRGTIESILTSCISVWSGASSVSDWKYLQRVKRTGRCYQILFFILASTFTSNQCLTHEWGPVTVVTPLTTSRTLQRL